MGLRLWWKILGLMLFYFSAPGGTVESGSKSHVRVELVAMAGGILLNLMPCVCPVLSLKAISLVQAQDSFWEPYSEERLAELRAQHRPVFLNITADWCISCIANERVALSMTSVRNVFREKNIAALKGDWTNNHPRITEILASFNRNGVPLYVLYPPGEDVEPIMLPQWLTPFNVISALDSI